MALDWQLLSEAEREREYSPSSCVGGDISEFLTAYERQSVEARARCVASGATYEEVRYGAAASQTIDLFVPADIATPAPLVIFIHGGYWQALSKNESAFAAADALHHEFAFAAVDYTLAPHASLDEIVAECRAAVATLRDQAATYGLDTGRFVVGGSSAGGHLSAMVGLDWANDGWRPAALALISGVFELEPLIGTSINDAVGLDIEAAHRNSPLRGDLRGYPPALIAYGDNETDQFKRQSQELAAALAEVGAEVTCFEVPQRNHFDIILDLCNADTLLGRRVIDLVASTAGR